MTKKRQRNSDWLRDRVKHRGAECLIWPFSRNQQGYGQVYDAGKIKKAHRLMCELAHGKRPASNLYASHSCGKGHEGCVNPRHLSWQTAAENQYDRRRHGTSHSHVGAKARKLSKEAIRTIQAERGKTSIWKLAQRFGVVHGTISYWHRKMREATISRGYERD